MAHTILSIQLTDAGLAVGLDRTGHDAGSIADTLVRPATDQHSDILIPAIDELLASARCGVADLTGIAFDAGPGGFTRIRVACAVAQGLAFSHDIPVAPIDSLASAALAAWADNGATGSTRVLVAMDARMGECYVGDYHVQPGSVAALAGAQLVPADGLAEWLGTVRDVESSALVLTAGDALARYDVTAPSHVARDMGMPRASALIHAVMQLARQSADWVTAAHAAPRYIRNKVALNVHEQAARRGDQAARR